MMIHAYQEMYLSSVQTTLAETFDYAINTCKINGDDFIKLFVASSVSKRIENADISYILSKSGIEIAIDIFNELGISINFLKPKITYDRSIEYWIGYAISYYQWFSKKRFEEIFSVISYNELKIMYNTLHEADISKFVDVLDAKIKENSSETNLKRFRSLYGISQSQLSKLSGVNLRSIQMYEQKNKDINKASGETLYSLSKVLGCTMEQLLES